MRLLCPKRKHIYEFSNPADMHHSSNIVASSYVIMSNLSQGLAWAPPSSYVIATQFGGATEFMIVESSLAAAAASRRRGIAGSTKIGRPGLAAPHNDGDPPETCLTDVAHRRGPAFSLPASTRRSRRSPEAAHWRPRSSPADARLAACRSDSAGTAVPT